MSLIHEIKDEIQELGFLWEVMGKNKIVIQGIPQNAIEEDDDESTLSSDEDDDVNESDNDESLNN